MGASDWKGGRGGWSMCLFVPRSCSRRELRGSIVATQSPSVVGRADVLTRSQL